MNLVDEELQVKIEKYDELISLVKGYITMSKYKSMYEIQDNINNKTYLEDTDMVYNIL